MDLQMNKKLKTNNNYIALKLLVIILGLTIFIGLCVVMIKIVFDLI